MEPVAGTEEVVNSDFGDLGHREFPLAAIRPSENICERHAFTPRRAVLRLGNREQTVRLGFQWSERRGRVVERQVAERRKIEFLVIERTQPR
jgi:hypothetical protein